MLMETTLCEKRHRKALKRLRKGRPGTFHSNASQTGNYREQWNKMPVVYYDNRNAVKPSTSRLAKMLAFFKGKSI